MNLGSFLTMMYTFYCILSQVCAYCIFYYLFIVYILSVYSPFSDRVGLPLHNITSPFPSVMDISFVCRYILSVYSPFSDGFGLPHHNAPFSVVLMNSIGAAFFSTG